MKAAMDHMETDEQGCVPVGLHLQKEVGAWSQPMGRSMPSLLSGLHTQMKTLEQRLRWCVKANIQRDIYSACA